MRLLVKAEAFDFTEKNKKELLWEIHSLINPVKKKEISGELFDVKPKKYKLPALNQNSMDDAFDQIQLIGFSLQSPFDLLREPVVTTSTARDLKTLINRNVSLTAYLITIKNTYTSKGERMCFGTFIDVEGNWIDTVHFPPSIKQYPFNGSGCYLISGKVVEEYDFITIEVNEMKRLPVIDREKLNYK
jgi:DNA polymerase-3 subunit alpha